MSVATNFDKSRGWVRSNWKTKNHLPGQEKADDFLNLDLTSSEGSPNREQSNISPLSPTKSVKKNSLMPDKILDLTKDENYGIRPTTAVLAKQLDAIEVHNITLPPRKKAKETIEEMPAPNVYARPYIRKEYKKGKPATRELSVKHFNLGFVDGSNLHNPDKSRLASENFAISKMSRGLQMQESKNNIAFLRKHYGHLIGAVDNKETESENLFSDSLAFHLKKKYEGAISLSVYNKPAALGRPKTAGENILKGIKGLEPVAVDEEGNPIEQAEPDSRIADMKPIPGLNMLARTFTAQHRTQQMAECIEIKTRLAREGINIPMKTLEKAIMIPEDCEWLPKKRQIPNAGDGLMANPFPKPKKGKKKKGKKKK